jgi:hypothetical protein
MTQVLASIPLAVSLQKVWPSCWQNPEKAQDITCQETGSVNVHYLCLVSVLLIKPPGFSLLNLISFQSPQI